MPRRIVHHVPRFNTGAQISSELQQYLETILWAETDESNESGGEPLDRNYTIEDFSQESLERANRQLTAFLTEADSATQVQEDAAEEAGVEEDWDFTEDDLAHDFWLTRNGHGTGFWDRPERYGDRLSEVFSKMAERAGEAYVYVGDDGQLHLEGGR